MQIFVDFSSDYRSKIVAIEGNFEALTKAPRSQKLWPRGTMHNSDEGTLYLDFVVLCAVEPGFVVESICQCMVILITQMQAPP